MAKDYYLVLGVSRTETGRGIRAAYRQLAKQFHPDRLGSEATRVFQEINEAYQTLSDPDRRRAHNDALRAGENARPARPEPLVPDPFLPEPISVFDHPESIRPSAESLPQHLDALHLDLVLSPEEAARGVLLRVRVPVFHRCPLCGGTGSHWMLPCLHCGPQGMVEDEATVPIRVPAMVPPGSVFEIPLGGLGIDNLRLRLHVAVSG